jgi:hypothetical protein
MLYKKRGFFLGLFSFTSKCNFLSGELMNAKNPEKKPITKVLLPTHALAVAMRILFFFLGCHL